MTWKELKEKIEKLSPEQQDMSVVVLEPCDDPVIYDVEMGIARINQTWKSDDEDMHLLKGQPFLA